MTAVSNEALLALEAVRERVERKRQEVTAMWTNPPPPVMLAYGAVVLTSGVLFSALGQWSVLQKGYMWGSGLAGVLKLTFVGKGLTVLAGSERKVGDAVRIMRERVGLPAEMAEEVDDLFLELLQWNVVESVNLELASGKRERMADLLREEQGDIGRSETILKFLAGAGVDSVKCKKLLETAVEKSLLVMAGVFEQRGYVGMVESVKVMVG